MRRIQRENLGMKFFPLSSSFPDFIMHYRLNGGCPLVHLDPGNTDVCYTVHQELLLALPNLGWKPDPIGHVLLARARKRARAGVAGAGCLERVEPVQLGPVQLTFPFFCLYF